MRVRRGVPDTEVIREFNDRGIQWLLTDPLKLAELVRLVDPLLADRLDFRRARLLNRTLIAADLARQETDMLWQVPYSEQLSEGPGEVLVYLLLEHQSEPDPELGLRLLLAMTQLWRSERRAWRRRAVPPNRRRLRPVIPLVFFTGEGGWPGPDGLTGLVDVPETLRRFVPHWDTLNLGLQRVSPDSLSDLATTLKWILRVLQKEDRPLPELRQALKEALAGLESLGATEAAEWEEAAWFFVLLAFHRRTPKEYAELEHLILGATRSSSFAEQGREEQMSLTMAQLVEQRGEQRGIAIGEQRRARQVLEAVLEGKFGRVPAAYAGRIMDATPDTLQEWTLRAAIAVRLEEVFGEA